MRKLWRHFSDLRYREEERRKIDEIEKEQRLIAEEKGRTIRNQPRIDKYEEILANLKKELKAVQESHLWLKNPEGFAEPIVYKFDVPVTVFGIVDRDDGNSSTEDESESDQIDDREIFEEPTFEELYDALKKKNLSEPEILIPFTPAYTKFKALLAPGPTFSSADNAVETLRLYNEMRHLLHLGPSMVKVLARNVHKIEIFADVLAIWAIRADGQVETQTKVPPTPLIPFAQFNRNIWRTRSPYNRSITLLIGENAGDLIQDFNLKIRTVDDASPNLIEVEGSVDVIRKIEFPVLELLVKAKNIVDVYFIEETVIITRKNQYTDQVWEWGKPFSVKIPVSGGQWKLESVDAQNVLKLDDVASDGATLFVSSVKNPDRQDFVYRYYTKYDPAAPNDPTKSKWITLKVWVASRCLRCNEDYIRKSNRHGACVWHPVHARRYRGEYEAKLQTLSKLMAEYPYLSKTMSIPQMIEKANKYKISIDLLLIIDAKLRYIAMKYSSFDASFTATPDQLKKYAVVNVKATSGQYPVDFGLAPSSEEEEKKNVIPGRKILVDRPVWELENYITKYSKPNPSYELTRIFKRLFTEETIEVSLRPLNFDIEDAESYPRTPESRNPNYHYGLGVQDGERIWQCCGRAAGEKGCYVGWHSWNSDFPNMTTVSGKDSSTRFRGTQYLNDGDTADAIFNQVENANLSGNIPLTLELEGKMNRVHGGVMAIDISNISSRQFDTLEDILQGKKYDAVEVESFVNDLIAYAGANPILGNNAIWYSSRKLQLLYHTGFSSQGDYNLRVQKLKNLLVAIDSDKSRAKVILRIFLQKEFPGQISPISAKKLKRNADVQVAIQARIAEFDERWDREQQVERLQIEGKKFIDEIENKKFHGVDIDNQYWKTLFVTLDPKTKTEEDIPLREVSRDATKIPELLQWKQKFDRETQGKVFYDAKAASDLMLYLQKPRHFPAQWAKNYIKKAKKELDRIPKELQNAYEERNTRLAEAAAERKTLLLDFKSQFELFASSSKSGSVKDYKFKPDTRAYYLNELLLTNGTINDTMDYIESDLIADDNAKVGLKLKPITEYARSKIDFAKIYTVLLAKNAPLSSDSPDMDKLQQFLLGFDLLAKEKEIEVEYNLPINEPFWASRNVKLASLNLTQITIPTLESLKEVLRKSNPTAVTVDKTIAEIKKSIAEVTREAREKQILIDETEKQTLLAQVLAKFDPIVVRADPVIHMYNEIFTKRRPVSIDLISARRAVFEQASFSDLERYLADPKTFDPFERQILDLQDEITNVNLELATNFNAFVSILETLTNAGDIVDPRYITESKTILNQIPASKIIEKSDQYKLSADKMSAGFIGDQADFQKAITEGGLFLTNLRKEIEAFPTTDEDELKRKDIATQILDEYEHKPNQLKDFYNARATTKPFPGFSMEKFKAQLDELFDLYKNRADASRRNELRKKQEAKEKEDRAKAEAALQKQKEDEIAARKTRLNVLTQKYKDLYKELNGKDFTGSLPVDDQLDSEIVILETLLRERAKLIEIGNYVGRISSLVRARVDPIVLAVEPTVVEMDNDENRLLLGAFHSLQEPKRSEFLAIALAIEEQSNFFTVKFEKDHFVFEGNDLRQFQLPFKPTVPFTQDKIDAVIQSLESNKNDVLLRIKTAAQDILANRKGLSQVTTVTIVGFSDALVGSDLDEVRSLREAQKLFKSQMPSIEFEPFYAWKQQGLGGFSQTIQKDLIQQLKDKNYIIAVGHPSKPVRASSMVMQNLEKIKKASNDRVQTHVVILNIKADNFDDQSNANETKNVLLKWANQSMTSATGSSEEPSRAPSPVLPPPRPPTPIPILPPPVRPPTPPVGTVNVVLIGRSAFTDNEWLEIKKSLIARVPEPINVTISKEEFSKPLTDSVIAQLNTYDFLFLTGSTKTQRATPKGEVDSNTPRLKVPILPIAVNENLQLVESREYFEFHMKKKATAASESKAGFPLDLIARMSHPDNNARAYNSAVSVWNAVADREIYRQVEKQQYSGKWYQKSDVKTKAVSFVMSLRQLPMQENFNIPESFVSDEIEFHRTCFVYYYAISLLYFACLDSSAPRKDKFLQNVKALSLTNKGNVWFDLLANMDTIVTELQRALTLLMNLGDPALRKQFFTFKNQGVIGPALRELKDLALKTDLSSLALIPTEKSYVETDFWIIDPTIFYSQLALSQILKTKKLKISSDFWKVSQFPEDKDPLKDAKRAGFFGDTTRKINKKFDAFSKRVSNSTAYEARIKSKITEELSHRNLLLPQIADRSLLETQVKDGKWLDAFQKVLQVLKMKVTPQAAEIALVNYLEWLIWTADFDNQYLEIAKDWRFPVEAEFLPGSKFGKFTPEVVKFPLNDQLYALIVFVTSLIQTFIPRSERWINNILLRDVGAARKRTFRNEINYISAHNRIIYKLEDVSGGDLFGYGVIGKEKDILTESLNNVEFGETNSFELKEISVSDQPESGRGRLVFLRTFLDALALSDRANRDFLYWLTPARFTSVEGFFDQYEMFSGISAELVNTYQSWGLFPTFDLSKPIALSERDAASFFNDPRTEFAVPLFTDADIAGYNMHEIVYNYLTAKISAFSATTKEYVGDVHWKGVAVKSPLYREHIVQQVALLSDSIDLFTDREKLDRVPALDSVGKKSGDITRNTHGEENNYVDDIVSVFRKVKKESFFSDTLNFNFALPLKLNRDAELLVDILSRPEILKPSGAKGDNSRPLKVVDLNPDFDDLSNLEKMAFLIIGTTPENFKSLQLSLGGSLQFMSENLDISVQANLDWLSHLFMSMK